MRIFLFLSFQCFLSRVSVHFHYVFSCVFLLLFLLHFNLWLSFYFLTLDPVVDNIDENLLNLAYSDQHIDDGGGGGDDEIMRIENRRCCKGIFTGSQHDEDQIRERTQTHFAIMVNEFSYKLTL